MALRNSLELTMIIRYGTTMSVSQIIKMKTVAVLTVALFVSVSSIHNTFNTILNGFSFFESLKSFIWFPFLVVLFKNTIHMLAATDLSCKTGSDSSTAKRSAIGVSVTGPRR